MTDNELLSAMSNVLKSELQPLKDDIQGIKDDIQGMKDDIQGMKNDIIFLTENSQKHDIEFTKLSRDVKEIQLTLENEIRPNIMRVAEGHLDLYRKSNEILKVGNDIQAQIEIYDIQIRSHDNALSNLKAVK